MSFDELKNNCFLANKRICDENLLKLTWGNASILDREQGVFAIKPSGVGYDVLKPEDICIVDLESHRMVEGSLKSSSDTPTHSVLYKAFPSIGSVIHVHSCYAVALAQAGKSLPCYGTTHADHFCGEIPITRPLKAEEIGVGYEAACGSVLVETVGSNQQAAKIPAALLRHHGPFIWGGTGHEAVENTIVLEACAKMAIHTLSANKDSLPIPKELQDFHYNRKHGPSKYYGQ